MAAPNLIQRYRYDDYKEWEDSWELIDGIPYAMAPAPYPKHQKIVAHIWRELDKNLKCIFKDMCEVYISPVDWKVDDTTVVQPDVAIFCEKSDKQYFLQTPLLVVEVLSLSTALKDTTVKFELYQKEGVKSYIIIDPDTKRGEIFELNDGKYELIKAVNRDDVYDFLDKECETRVDFSNVF
jgi:Uma2 family endonuclease